jgi:hypothetical protein
MPGPMEAEFDTVAGWTAQVAAGLGPEYYVPAGCRGSGLPAALDDPPQGNHFPTSSGLHSLLRHADLDVLAVADAEDMPEPPAAWQDRAAAVERELQRRFGHTPQLAAATEQSRRIGRLLTAGQLTSQVILLNRN